MSETIVQRAMVEDADEILALQKLAYQSEAAIWNDYSIPPLRQSLEELCEEFKDHVILKLCEDGMIMGSVRAVQRVNTCYIGRVIVHPERQNKGLGKLLMAAIEGEFPKVSRFELFTGTKSERNLYFYQKLGYKIYDQRPLSKDVSLYYLEKRVD